VAELFSKDEDLPRSAPAIGFEILKMLQNEDSRRVSIFDVVKQLKETNRASVRNVYYGMLFLYALDLIDFNAPYLSGKC
jgi:hypothetical protein